MTLDDLSKNKIATQSRTYAASGSNVHHYVASNAVDRDITTCMRTDAIGTNSCDQAVWWKVDLGGVYNIYSVNILFKNYDGYERRQQGRFAGFSIYVSTNGTRDNSSLCYKDGHKLPSLNFSTHCVTFGRYVTFFNERLRGVTYPDGYVDSVYTELCEVTVQGCQASGVYGDSCKEQCPTNCRDNVCHIQKGTCFGCAPGWMDITCNKICDDGIYGNNCVHNCSGNCLSDSPCNTQTGHCDMGCKPGYTNALCKEPCKEGYHGQNCSHLCSPNCKTCKHTDETCSCQAGWMGPNCSIGCMQFYGKNCQFPCSKHCVNQTCNRFHGICQFGCESGYHGQKCEQEFPSTICLSTISSGLVGSSVSACVFITTAVVILIIRRRKKFCFPGRPRISNKDSPYAEIENQKGGASTYQELTI
uniref:Scavenger receptor class F member 2-like n=1 Tax=Crassostrea virginica TaxID=6565 RepID=A0A8B8C6N5_CRAVI|nr:scavenger receptor class F member 2-like [Crassostrea virginica]